MKFYSGIPTYFDFANNFAYFKTLADTEHNSPIVASYKRNLYTKAKREADKAKEILAFNDSNTRINDAIEFLRIVAESERKKEMRVMEAYKQELDNKFKNNPDVMRRINILFKGYNPNDPNEFYKNLIYLFNLIRYEYISLQNKLDKLKNTLEKNEDVYAKNFILRSDNLIRGMIRRLNGTGRASKKKETNYFNKTIQDAVFRIISNKSYLRAINNDPENLTALASVIEIDLMSILDEEMYNQQLKTLDDLDASTIEKVVMGYMNSQYNTKLLNMLNNDHRQLLNLLGDAKKILNIKTLSDDDFEKQKASRAKANRQGLSSFFTQAGIRQDKLLKGLKRITVSSSTNTSHGLIGELTDLTIDRLNSRKFGGEGATDVLQAGSIYSTITYDNIVNDQLDILVEAVEESNKLIKSGNKELIESTYKSMNEKIRESEEEIEKRLKELEIKDDFFIYHDSVKTYKQTYQGISHALHGRSLSAFTYITELYAMTGELKYDSLTMPAQEWLEFIVMNLFTGGVAEEARNPLEKYLSIFAGLFMFDDAINIAMGAIKSIQSETNSKVKSIHLFNVNQLYVPASFVLQNLYETLTKSMTMLDNGAHVKITDAGSKAVKEEENGETKSYAKRWYNVSDAVKTATKVNIVFLSSFLETIRDL